jgi:hypothetical protein
MTSGHHFEKSQSVSGVRKENRVHYANKKRRMVSEQDGHPFVLSAHNSYLNSEKSSTRLIAPKNKVGDYPSNTNSSSYAGLMMPIEPTAPYDSWPPHDPRCRDQPDPNVDGLQQAICKLLDIADRIPFIGVESTNSKVFYFRMNRLLRLLLHTCTFVHLFCRIAMYL